MKMFTGTLKKEELSLFYNDAITYNIRQLNNLISEYEAVSLFHNWRLLIQSIDEFINIAYELKNPIHKHKYLSLNFDFTNRKNLIKLGEVRSIIESTFDNAVWNRFKDMCIILGTIDKVYQEKGIWDDFGNKFSTSSVSDSILFLQSRRLYYVTIFNLIPTVAKGNRKSEFINLFNDFQYYIDHFMVGVTSAHFGLILNHCFTDYELNSNGNTAKANYEFNHLDSFFLDPQRLSLADQIELRPDPLIVRSGLGKSAFKIFSFSEIADCMSLFQDYFKKYNVEYLIQFSELNLLLCDLAPSLINDFDFEISHIRFEEISEKYKSLNLFNKSEDYYETLNSPAPFQKIENVYYSTVVLLTRFVYRTVYTSLLKNRRFQVHSGFIFESRVSQILNEKGYLNSGITRINRKEFDVVTVKNNKIFNFQCKNNFMDISDIGQDYKKISQLNSLLVNYYERSLLKEKSREGLLLDKLSKTEIEHFVITRFPVITKNSNIINFNNLHSWFTERED